MALISRAQKYKRKENELLRQRAWAEARKIAAVLGKKFGARRVVLYGSLARKKGHFDAASDIDLAVAGLGERYFQAYGLCLRLCAFNIDIKPYEALPEGIKDKIEQEGSLLYERR